MPFWLDTICIPVGDEHEAARKAAITQMTDIFKGAAKVLVLSKELEELSSSMDPAELILRICKNPWFRRLWTLEEGT